MNRITLSSEHTVYAMSAANPPALHVSSGAELAVQTCDCFHGQIVSAQQSIDALDWERINPATGPIYVQDAAPGDALKVTIERIRFTGNGVMASIPDVGIFGDEVAHSAVRILQVAGDQVVFGDGVHLPVKPMIGVIGTAPEQGSVPCGTPGSHGGNMDCVKIAPGSALYLPVHHAGGLLAMGDVHACMGDGEVMGTGVEIPAVVEVRVEVVKEWPGMDPVVETAEMLYVVSSDTTLERAAKRAAHQVRRMVERARGLDSAASGMLLSAAGSVEVCQMVDPLVTVRFGLPRTLLRP